MLRLEQKWIIIYDTNYKVQNVIKCIGFTDFYSYKNSYVIFLFSRLNFYNLDTYDSI